MIVAMNRYRNFWSKASLYLAACSLVVILSGTYAFAIPLEDFVLGNEEIVESDEAEGEGSQKIPVSKTTLEFNLPEMPFRLSEDQLPYVIESLNQQLMEKGIEDSRGDAVCVKDLLKETTLEYPSELNESGFSAFLRIALSEEYDNKYELLESRLPFIVNPIRQENDSSSLILLNGNKSLSWLQDSPIFKCNEHLLSSFVDKGYGEEIQLEIEEGISSSLKIYAKNVQTSVITIFDNLEYKRDKSVPYISSYSVDSEFKGLGPVWFFNNELTVTIAVTDGSPKFPNRENYKAESSGLAPQVVAIEYLNQLSTSQVVYSSLLPDESQATGLLQFKVECDADIQLDSITITIKDNAGNVGRTTLKDAKLIPLKVINAVVDATKPQLSIEYDNNDAGETGFFSKGRTASIYIREPLFHYVQSFDANQEIVTLSINESTKVLHASDFLKNHNGIWCASYYFSEEGACSIKAQVEDLTGKTSEYIQDSFFLDFTHPVLSLSYDSEESELNDFYNGNKSAYVKIKEANFDPSLIKVQTTYVYKNEGEARAAQISQWFSEADTHWCVIEFSGEGLYSFSVSGNDKAGNSLNSYSSNTFTIDKTPPQIKIDIAGSEAINEKAYISNAGITISLSDIALDATSQVEVVTAGLSTSVNPYTAAISVGEKQAIYSYSDPAFIPQNDNVYKVTANALDFAGNKYSKTIVFSLNRFGSTYRLNADSESMLAKKYIPGSEVQDICFTEFNPSGIDAKKSSVKVTTNFKSKTLQQGSQFSVNAQREGLGTKYEYVIYKENFLKEGTYSIDVTSEDNAGNLSSIQSEPQGKESRRSNIEFVIDNTAPLVVITTQESSLNPNAQDVYVNITDNTRLKEAVIYKNDEVVETIAASNMPSVFHHKIPLSLTHNGSSIKVVARDFADNYSTELYQDNATNTNIFQQFLQQLNNVRSFQQVLFVMLVSLGFGSILLILKHLHVSGKSPVQKKTTRKKGNQYGKHSN